MYRDINYIKNIRLIFSIYCFTGSGQLEFEEFVTLAAGFLTEDEPEDVEAMQAELKEAFRLYDKEGLKVKFESFILLLKLLKLHHIRKWLHNYRCFKRNTQRIR